MGGGRILDISHTYRTTMPFWGSTEGLSQFLWLPPSIKNGSLANNSEIKFPTHTGTHVDAPGHIFDHYFDAGFDVDTLDLEVLNGPVFLVDVPRNSNITAEVMKSLHIPKGVRRVLFRTLYTDRKLMWKTDFDTSYVGFMKNGAKWLVEDTDIKLFDVLTFCNPNSNSRKLRKEVIQSQYLQITRVGVFITLLGADFMRMKSFAKVEEFAETLVADMSSRRYEQ
ncbi:hypothetical protein C5167_026825 [Papaver somniferum]|nr:hypothetical protein C5167_026825 [Papaver somniferum]